MIHNIRRITKFVQQLCFLNQESRCDSLIPTVIPRAINMIQNSCGPLVITAANNRNTLIEQSLVCVIKEQCL